MKKYILNILQTEKMHAGSKAQDDISLFLHQVNYMNIYIDGEMNKYERLLFFKHDFEKKISILDADDVLLIQYPFYLGTHVQNVIAKCLNAVHIKSVILIHDIPSLRLQSSSSSISKEISWLNKFKVLISHNSEMTKWLRNNGCTSELVNLKLFDYYINENDSPVKKIEYKTKPKVLFAGNIGKSKFLEKLNPKKFELDLIGIGDSNFIKPNVKHLGAFAPEELPAHIKGEFGLVWDGNSLNDSTDYMRFNNPHKMSLYLASGLPVIVWDKAATAEYVENNRVGITIGSLTDLNSRLDNISKDEYVIYQQNAMNIAKKLREGFYTHSAIQSVERIVK